MDFQIFHVDDCVYVAALTEADALAHIKQEHGDDCGDSVELVPTGMPVQTANIDEGEKPTDDSTKVAEEIVRDHMANGGTLPWIIAFDNEG